ncbi:mechanosensitive ion channel family protein [Nocardioides pantholopis]|uniref:mechanosensitive ion channel family protein n=1 Tax=Nocardioides pantholopis TaxID=2483798 RepID=UPI000F09A334|nr:mechanosensitive ion channel domain-containing protein [Nocardioides pantholopis]
MAVSVVQALAGAAAALLSTLLVVVLAHLLARRAVLRWPASRRLLRHLRVPFRALLLIIAAAGWIAAVRLWGADDAGWDAAALVARIAMIAVVAWLICVVLLFIEDLGLGRPRAETRDDRLARRLRTQVLLVRRLTIAGVVVMAAGSILLSFPGVRALGASVLASAGLLSVIAAVAAQSALANLFAGIQLAFSDAIKVDDAVIVEGEWGRIEEITLSYVVVRLWDDRRMILPSTYFITTPFQNWTRRNSELLGAVELDLDWNVDTVRIRQALPAIMADAGPMWDGRVAHFQVTDAVQGWVRVRVLVTSHDAPTLFDLRCFVREQLVVWLREHNPDALPHVRLREDRD